MTTIKKLLAICLALALTLAPSAGFAASGCSYPGSLDSYSDKSTGDFLTVADVNSRSCAIEQLEIRLNQILAGKAGGQTISGGTAAGDGLTFKSTAGVGSGDFIIFKGGNNGATTWGTLNSSGLALTSLTANSFVFPGASGLLTSTAAATDGQILIGRTGNVPLIASLTRGTGMSSIAGGAGTITVNGPLVIRKAATESVTSSTALQSDDELTFAIAASETWVFRLVLYAISAAAAPDIKLAFNAPTGALGRWGISGPTGTVSTGVNVAAVNMGYIPAATFVDGETLIAGVPTDGAMIVIEGTVVNSTTPGNFVLRWAQNASNASSVDVQADSKLIAMRP